mmetsp:Transcript_23162/g.59345  ORF Transcript_23162/g.59345 Transcript_23162/m.59345 type:complete len:417 (+) Transcript_23162:1747-2997(+)
MEQVALSRDVLRRVQVVARHHLDCDASCLADIYSIGDTRTYRILDAKDGHQGEALLQLCDVPRPEASGAYVFIHIARGDGEGAQPAGGHAGDELLQLGTQRWGELGMLSGVRESALASGENYLCSALYMECVRRARSRSGMGAALAQQHATSLAVRGKGGYRGNVGVLAELLVVGSPRTRHQQQRALGAVADQLRLRPLLHQESRGVGGDAVAQERVHLAGEILPHGGARQMLAAQPALHHCHAVLCQRASLVGADAGGSTHGLARRQVTHKVVVLHHLAHAVGKRDGNSQRETLRHRHDDDGDGVQEHVEHLVPLGAGGRETLDLNTQKDEEHHKTGHGHREPDLGHHCRHARQLLLQGCCLCLARGERKQAPPLGARPDRKNHHAPFAFHHLRARDDEWLHCGLRDGVRLTCQR